MDPNVRDLLVQDEDIENIADTMVRLPGEGPLKMGRWLDLAVKLGTDRARAEELKDDVENDHISLPAALQTIIAEWKSRNPHEAKLGYLIDVFNELKLNELATKMERYYILKIRKNSLGRRYSLEPTLEPIEIELRKLRRSGQRTIMEKVNERIKNEMINKPSDTLEPDVRDLVLDEKEIENISNTIVRLTGAGSLNKGMWIDLAVKLGTDTNNTESLREDLDNGSISFPDLLSKILTEWKSKNPQRAKLGHLIDVLNTLHLYLLATKLERYYTLRNRTDSSDKDSSGKTDLQTKPPASATNAGKYGVLRQVQGRWYNGWKFKIANPFTGSIEKYLKYSLVGFTFLIIVLHGGFLLNYNISTRYQYSKYYYEPPVQMSVQSYADYENVMHKLPFGSKIELTVYLQNSQDWPNNAELGNAHLVTSLKLEGELDITTIMTVLKGMVNVEKLQVTNTSQLFCHQEGTRSPRQIVKLELGHIKELILEDVGECPHFFRRLSKGVTMRNLRTLRIKSGVVDNNNIMYIRRLLQNADETLISIEFPNTLMLINIFDQKLGDLPSTKSLVIDFLDSAGADLLNINENTCDMLPKLTEILSYSGYLPWSHFLNLSGCKQLNSVTLGVSIPENVSTVDLREVKNKFPALAKGQLSFYFENISNGCSVLGMQESIEHLTFNDNCPKVDSNETS